MACRDGYLGKGGFDCGSNQLSAFPKLSSLLTFLFSDKKVRLPAGRQLPITNICIYSRCALHPASANFNCNLPDKSEF